MRLAAIPNFITLMRIVLVVPTAWLLWRSHYVEASVLMAIAGASDAVDGWLARRWNAVSRFGSAMDPMADKLLITAMFVIFTIQRHLPLWLLLLVIGRDLCILGGAGVYRVLFGRIEFAPTLVSKANTAAQIAVLLMLLVELCRFGWVSEALGQIVDPWSLYVLAVLAIVSGIDYVITWSVRAVRQSRANRTHAG